jgi:hypothetical protein
LIEYTQPVAIAIEESLADLVGIAQRLAEENEVLKAECEGLRPADKGNSKKRR